MRPGVYKEEYPGNYGIVVAQTTFRYKYVILTLCFPGEANRLIGNLACTIGALSIMSHHILMIGTFFSLYKMA